MSSSQQHYEEEEYESWLSKVQTNGYYLQEAPEALRADKRVVLAAVQQNGNAIYYASPSLKNDKDVALETVQKKGDLLQYVSSDLRNDKDVVLAAIQNDPWALEHASPNLRQDDEIVFVSDWLIKLKRNGKILKDAPEEVRADRRFVMAAVRHTGYALEFASEDLRDDREVVLAAVRESGFALQHASPDLQNDTEVVLAAVHQGGHALKFAPPTLQNDKDIVMAAVQRSIFALSYASPDLRNDKEVVLTAVKALPDSIKYAPDNLKRDPDVLIAAGMYEENHKDATTRNQDNQEETKKIVLSTRFSLDPSTKSQATNFTKMLKGQDYIVHNQFAVYAPNAFDKKTCDPNWTDFQHPCRGTKDTCKYDNKLTENGYPTDDCCWRYSYQSQLKEAKRSGGFMLQLVETGKMYAYVKDATLGKGQEIEKEMARSLGLKTFHVYRPYTSVKSEASLFSKRHMEEVVDAIRKWYEEGCQDVSTISVVHPRNW